MPARKQRDPDNTAFTPLDFVAYPYSHSLPLLVAWGLGLGVLTRTHVGGRAAIPLIAGLVVSRWVLDWITHRSDMPLFPGGPHLGLGLWNSVSWTLGVELAIVGALVIAAWAWWVDRHRAVASRID